MGPAGALCWTICHKESIFEICFWKTLCTLRKTTMLRACRQVRLVPPFGERLGVFQPADTKAIHQKGWLDLVTFPSEEDYEAPGSSCQYQGKGWAALGAQVLDIRSTGYHLLWDYAVVCILSDFASEEIRALPSSYVCCSLVRSRLRVSLQQIKAERTLIELHPHLSFTVRVVQ